MDPHANILSERRRLLQLAIDKAGKGGRTCSSNSRGKLGSRAAIGSRSKTRRRR